MFFITLPSIIIKGTKTMKRNIFKITLLIVCISLFPQIGNADETITINGFLRTYKLYVPAKPKGVIVALHGLGDNSNFFFNTYPMMDFADQNGYIIIAPQALAEQNPNVVAYAASLSSFVNIPTNAVWGCGVKVDALGTVLELNAAINDEEFIRQIIAKTLSDYSLPEKNIFVFGVSLGGFMTYQYAEKYLEQLSGIISVAGSRGLGIDGTSSVSIPVLDFHSEQDEVVPYSGVFQIVFFGTPMNIGIAQDKTDVISYWVQRNGASTTPTTENVNYHTSTKNISVTKYTYSQTQGNEVVHYKMNSPTIGIPGHTYLFSAANGDCMDYAEEIAKFISAHSENLNNIDNTPANAVKIVGYYDIVGKRLQSEPANGIYIIVYDNGTAKKVVKLGK